VAKLAIDRQQNVPRQVYDLLRERIQSAEFAPGASINERYLTEILGVSRTPIREAIRRLSDDGLLTIIPNVGTTVALVNPARIIEYCIIRSSLECAVIEVAVKNFDTTADRRLSQLIDEQDETISTGNMVRNIAVDTEFHRFIVELSGFKTVENILKTTMGEIMRARHLSIKLPGRLREPILEHRIILDALRSGDPKKCSAAIKDHLDKSYLSIMQVIETLQH
jgi:GntR family transcriptional regulator, rspAB operon transcriptional repressor